ncbi:hypothetical protein [Corynebacterium lujinxingii]|uniref:Uncharacterized protein n=1 Tax=Corynebacterium lujinxingii TaxID=2763010 RepID=A0A7H0JY54_9CORY|nr:hypothetical protein [Corynebacterium lujinxingii]MBC3178333.1 hypothetical protein [Corynebacterium lujinxingii]NNO10790.1 hypothetical protein [Corynebacterium lujinxingii]QNP89970.1 hypothetical protein IAU68_09985 [Corynebacterium lujinxingii]
MKRITRTLTAATMAGAVAFAAVPAAQAQTLNNEELARVLGEVPQVLKNAEGNYYKLEDGKFVQVDAAQVAEADRANAPTVAIKGTEVAFSFEDNRPAVTLTAAPATTTTTVNTPVAPEGSAASETTTVLDTTVETTVTNTDAAPAGGSSLSGGAIAGIAAAALIPIVIAGVTYYLNQDGQTLVGSSDRVNQQPTPEEKAESDRLRAEHADEIAAQEEAAAEAARGISAETGSNTLVRTLFALLIAVVLGSAAFVAGRRFLV